MYQMILQNILNYSNNEWDEDDFLDLVEMVELDERGCYVMLSNSVQNLLSIFQKNKYNIIKIPIHEVYLLI